MRIVEWAPITWTDRIPPFGEELKNHLEGTRPGSESYAVWNLLYKVLQENGIEPGTVSFTEKGKPFFLGNHVYFSLTHTKGICAVSVADVPTGIDAEISNRVIPEKVLKRVLSSEELELCGEDPVLGWCRKEAIAKLAGCGILENSGFSTIGGNVEFTTAKIVSDGIACNIVTCFQHSGY